MSSIILNYSLYEYKDCQFVEALINKIILHLDALLDNSNLTMSMIDDNNVLNTVSLKPSKLDEFIDDIVTHLYVDAVDALDYGLVGEDNKAKWWTDSISDETDIRDIVEKYAMPIFSLVEKGFIPIANDYVWRNGMLLLQLTTLDYSGRYENYIGDDGEFDDIKPPTFI